MNDGAPSKVVSLTGAVLPGEIPTTIVELLEELLDDAKSGKISDIAIATVAPNGVICCAKANSGQPHAHHLVAAALYLLRVCEKNAGIE